VVKRPAAIEAVLPITLGQFVKLAGLAATGGDAKRIIAAGQVRVNGETDIRRGHKLALGDLVEAGSDAAVVVGRDPAAPTDQPKPDQPKPAEPSPVRPERTVSSQD
jgi:ribosome-associated protein